MCVGGEERMNERREKVRMDRFEWLYTRGGSVKGYMKIAWGNGKRRAL